MKRTNEHNEQYKLDKESARAQKLKAKFQPKSFAQEYKSVYFIAFGAAILFQALSLLTALTLPASWVHSICYNWALGFCIAIPVLILLEVVKRIVIGKAIKNGYQFGRWLSFGMFAGIMLSVASIVSSTLGTPILIKEFGASPTLQDTTGAGATLAAKQAEITAFWMPQIEQAESDAKATHKANSWKGVTTRSARPTVLKYQQQAQGYRDSLNTALALAAKTHENALISAQNQNSDTIQADKQKKAETGYILGFITLGLELLFLACSFWREYYDYREALEVLKKQPQPLPNQQEQPDNVRDINDVKKKNIKQQAKDLRSSGMSYRNIGKQLGVTHTSARRYVNS